MSKSKARTESEQICVPLTALSPDPANARKMSDADRFFSKTKRADVPRPGMATPCLEWQAWRDRNGYGGFKVSGKMKRAHREAWEIAHGPIPDGLHVLHKCDNPPCVAEDHLFLGTESDNAHDRDAKGRQSRGDSHWSRARPECLARGESHGARLHPERMPRGDANGSRLHPESRPRGESHANAKLTEDSVREIFKRRAQGWTCKRIAAEFGVSDVLVGLILAGKAWARTTAGRDAMEGSSL